MSRERLFCVFLSKGTKKIVKNSFLTFNKIVWEKIRYFPGLVNDKQENEHFWFHQWYINILVFSRGILAIFVKFAAYNTIPFNKSTWRFHLNFCVSWHFAPIYT